MKIYLDMCSLQRPLDTKTQLRIAVEAEAILGILTLCESGQAELVTSDALVFEAGRNPHPVRKRYAAEVLSKAKIFVHTDSRVAERAGIPWGRDSSLRRLASGVGYGSTSGLFLHVWRPLIEASSRGGYLTHQSRFTAWADRRGDAMNVQAKPLSEITQQAIDLLFKEMGIVNTMRFLNQFTTGYGDYTQEREALFKDLTLDEILSAMKNVPDQRNA
jgi:hypothetical protein